MTSGVRIERGVGTQWVPRTLVANARSATAHDAAHHQSPITTLDVHKGVVCSGGYDGRVFLTTFAGKKVWEFRAPDLINYVAFNPAGTFVAAACADSNIYVLGVESGNPIQVIGPHPDDVNAVAWNPAGSEIAYVLDTGDRDVHIWSLTLRRDVRTLIGHEHGVFAVCYDPTGRFIATAAEDRSARIWSVDGTQLHVLEHPGDPETIDWSPCGRYVATGCDDATLRLWSPSGDLVRQSQSARGAVRFVKFSPTGDLLLSGSYDATLRLHLVPDLSVVERLAAPLQWERSAAFLPNGVIVGSFGATPIIHRDGVVVESRGPTFGVNCLAAGVWQSREVVLAGRDDGALVDAIENLVLYRHESVINGVCLSSDGQRVASTDYLGVIAVYDRPSGRVVARHHLRTGPVNACVWDDNAMLMTAGYDGVIRWWTQSLELVDEVRAHQGPIKSLAWNASRRILIAGSSDDSLSAWQNRKQLFRTRCAGLTLVNGVTTAPDDVLFASVSRDRVVRIWHVESGELLEELPERHTRSVKAIAFSGDASKLITGGYDTNVIVWQRHAGSWASTVLQQHEKPGVSAVAFLGNTLITAGWDTRILRWSASGARSSELCSSSEPHNTIGGL